MKKSVLLVTLGLVALSLVVYFWRPAESSKKSLAIVTTLSHPALENARLGFINAIKQSGLNDMEIVDYNAEGNLQQANLIANKIRSDKNVVGIFAIGTLAAQALAKAERIRPIVIAAVSDPTVIVPDGLADNICGQSDSIDADYQIDTILKLLRNIRNVSVLFSANEDNSTSMVKRLSRAAKNRQLGTALVGIHEPQQIMSGSRDACLKGDVVVIPLDNQLAASIPAVIKATRSLPCAIITSHESPIHDGATLAFGIDYQKSGEAAGNIMQKILTKEATPKDIGFIHPASVDISINDAVVREKGLNPDLSTVPNIKHIQEERQ
ncbi:MAG TPA: ABC transporter substrate binding protein [Myxococcota bacterium]|nr:ABC transporter substrate binding protein [Myxococcota bacterium]